MTQLQSLIFRNRMTEDPQVIGSGGYVLSKILTAMRAFHLKSGMFKDQSPGLQQNRIETVHENPSICGWAQHSAIVSSRSTKWESTDTHKGTSDHSAPNEQGKDRSAEKDGDHVIDDAILRIHRIMKDETDQEERLYAGSVMRELVNPLEAANNIAYLLSVSTDDPTASDQYIKMLQGQLAVLNDVVRRALERMKNEH